MCNTDFKYGVKIQSKIDDVLKTPTVGALQRPNPHQDGFSFAEVLPGYSAGETSG
jgi:hypothetical protein